jgi:hypothetical protein
VRWNPAGVALGTHSVIARVDDRRGGSASCVTDVGVDRPNQPPTSPISVQPAGKSSARVRTLTSIPPTSRPSAYTATGHVSDGSGGTAVCQAGVTLETAAVEAKMAIRSIYFPTALPSPKSPDKGLMKSQQRTLTSLAATSRNTSQADRMRISSCKAMQIAAENRNTIKIFLSAASKSQNASLSDLAFRKEIL